MKVVGGGIRPQRRASVGTKLIGAGQSTALGCVEVGRLGLMDIELCRGIRHSVDGRPTLGVLGSCYASLPDGREACVCCSGKKQLLRKT